MAQAIVVAYSERLIETPIRPTATKHQNRLLVGFYRQPTSDVPQRLLGANEANESPS